MFIYVGIYDVYANNGGDIFISRTKYRIIAMIPVKKKRGDGTSKKHEVKDFISVAFS